jgi:hypothetical protein
MRALKDNAPCHASGEGAGTADSRTQFAAQSVTHTGRAGQWILVCSIVHPFVDLGRRLTDAEVLSQARAMAPEHFCDSRSSCWAAEQLALGAHILSWPDGTKASIWPAPVSQAGGLAAYRKARADLERHLALQPQAGSA